MGYNTPITAVPGAGIPASIWNTGVRDNFEDVAKPARCRVRRAASQSITSGATPAVIFDTEEYDTASMWSAAFPTRLIAPVSGTYRVSFGAQFVANATGARTLYVEKNAAIRAIYNTVGNAGWTVGAVVTTEDTMVAGEFFECKVYQTSGVALNLDTSSYPIWATLSLIAR